jgi:hypothetical protein
VKWKIKKRNKILLRFFSNKKVESKIGLNGCGGERSEKIIFSLINRTFEEAIREAKNCFLI